MQSNNTTYCAIQGCPSEAEKADAYGNGLCTWHYGEWKRYEASIIRRQEARLRSLA